jgi:Tfp pilus assembly protein PilX
MSSQKGFALVTAIIACVILFALAMLIINLSTGDLRVSVRSVGEKKAMSAAETGIHQLMRNFNDQNPAASAAANVPVDAANDPTTVYSVATPVALNPFFATMPGYGPEWAMARFATTITGGNTNYNATVTVNVGFGYGPVPSGSSTTSN